jgi:hypothetical protein
MKLLLTVMLSLLLTACSTQIKTVYQDRYVPIILVPPPPELTVPEYYINTLTEEQKQDIGEVTKAYVVSAQQAQNYLSNLKEVYNLYLRLAEDSAERIRKLETMGLEVDRTLLEQANIEIQQQLAALERVIDFENQLHSLQLEEKLSELE